MSEPPKNRVNSSPDPGTVMTLRGAPGYPARLERLPDPPGQFYVKGRLPEGPGVAIVGSRKADTNAQRFAFNLAGDLTKQGCVIVSGGALGIDSSAHRGALEAQGLTVAVIGSGFDYTYPESNRPLFAEITERGALVTEFAPEQPPTRWTFPKRNRIVAALSVAVVVVQAGARSGALITARLARSLQVPLGSVPGAPGDPQGSGSNRLLREGAAMVESAADVLTLMQKDGGDRANQLRLPNVDQGKKSPVGPAGLEPPELKILDMLGPSPVHIDDIIAESGLEFGETSHAILSLELAGVIEDQGGKYFVKVL
jgi:DNA processing protein